MKKNNFILTATLSIALCITSCSSSNYFTSTNGIETVIIHAGTFMMGSPTTEYIRQTNELQYSVTLTKGFKMSKYPITNAQYAKFLNDKGVGASGTVEFRAEAIVDEENRLLLYDSKTRLDGSWNWGIVWDGSKWTPVSGKSNFPVVHVTWYGAKAFAESVGGRLPTEAEWEYACRAGTTTAYNYGATPTGNYMWYTGNNGSLGSSTYGAKEVGMKPANTWGLYDMHGNAREWCNDWYAEYYGATAITDPTGPRSGSNRVIRGGGYNSSVQISRSAHRDHNTPTYSSASLGFRIVFDL